VAALLREICSSEGVSVLLVAHDVNPLVPYLDQVIYMAGGRARCGTVEQVITSRTLSELYGAPIEVLPTTDGRLVVVGHPEPPHHHGHRHERVA
jgi:zinc/manganese transport system ATP-binding protein